MKRYQFFMGIAALLLCLNFLLANLFWLALVDGKWITEAQGTEWYFKSAAMAYPAILWGIRELFKMMLPNPLALWLFVAFDFFMTVSLLGLIAELITDNTVYHPSQIWCIIVSLIISIYQFKRMKKKGQKQ